MDRGVIVFRAFDGDLRRDGFDCGNEIINRWFHHQAGQQERRNNTRTHLGLATLDARIASFFTLVSHQIEPADPDSPRGASADRYPVPAMLIAQLAVDVDYQGQGVGKLTLAHALLCLKSALDTVGFQAVVVDAVDDKAQQLYEGFGFEPLVEQGDRLVLSTKDLLKNFPEPQEENADER